MKYACFCDIGSVHLVGIARGSSHRKGLVQARAGPSRVQILFGGALFSPHWRAHADRQNPARAAYQHSQGQAPPKFHADRKK